MRKREEEEDNVDVFVGVEGGKRGGGDGGDGSMK